MFTKGKSGNPRGRPKGAKGKVSTDIKAFLQSVVIANYETIQKDLAALDAKDRLAVLEKFIGYLVPKATNHNVSVDKLTDAQIDELLNILGE